MKGWIRTGVAWTALAMASAVSAQSTAGERWAPIGEERGAVLHYDAASVRRTGALVRFRLRMVEGPNAQGETIRSIAQARIDCRSQRIAYLSFERFGTRGQSLGAVTPPEGESSQIYAGNMEGRLYQRLCPRALVRPLPRFEMPRIVQVPSPPPMMNPLPMAPPPPPLPPPPPPPPGRSARAQWRLPPHSFISTDDYPAAALRAEEEGRTQVRLSISRGGRVTRCTVVSSSGSASLDAATCRLMTMRAQFIPARDARGRTTRDEVLTAINWRLPAD